jgi:hypothetical protein
MTSAGLRGPRQARLTLAEWSFLLIPRLLVHHRLAALTASPGGNQQHQGPGAPGPNTERKQRRCTTKLETCHRHLPWSQDLEPVVLDLPYLPLADGFAFVPQV